MIKNIERTKDGIDSLIDRTRDAVVDVTERAERGVESAAERVTERAHSAGKYVRNGAKTASRETHQRLQGAAEAVDRGYVRVRGECSRAATAVRDYAAEHPGVTVILAASAGFVLGTLVRRRQPSC